ncbi:MAG: hypothetical protein ACOC8N_09525 [Spirochaetota bacterium]
MNERLRRKREQLLRKVEQGLAEDPGLEGVDTIGVKLETGGAVQRDEIHLVGTVPGEDLKRHAYALAVRAVGDAVEVVDDLEVEQQGP